MLLDIRTRCEQERLEPDAVFFTGDAAFSGQKEQYDLVSKWFDDILDACGLSGRRDRLFVVPGNHDVNRDEVKRANYTLSFHENHISRITFSLMTNKRLYSLSEAASEV
jgi:hypothetical protein